ncbi:MAG: hypothetical protein PHG81_11925 [Aliarcobacter sp.]|nr:hypothetical protein [Aliarcobacter sp.]
MSYEFEPISYGDMIKNARESLDWGTKELLEDSEDFFDDDLDYGFEKDEDGFYIIPDNPDYEMPYQNNLSYEDTTEFENYFDRDSSEESSEFFDGESFNFDLYDEEIF